MAEITAFFAFVVIIVWLSFHASLRYQSRADRYDDGTFTGVMFFMAAVLTLLLVIGLGLSIDEFTGPSQLLPDVRIQIGD